MSGTSEGSATAPGRRPGAAGFPTSLTTPSAKPGQPACPNGHPVELDSNFCQWCSVSIRRPKNKDWPKWRPPVREEFRVRLQQALSESDQIQFRLNAGDQCWELMDRAWTRHRNAGGARSKWNSFRYAGAVIPVLAAGAGASLLSQLHGSAGKIVGLWPSLGAS